MNCHLVYALVPKQSIEHTINEQAEKYATTIVNNAATHMSLENQGLGKQQLKTRIAELQKELIETMPRDLWDE